MAQGSALNSGNCSRNCATRAYISRVSPLAESKAPADAPTPLKLGRTANNPKSAHARLMVVTTLLSRVPPSMGRSEEHTSELQSRGHLVCRLLLEKKKQKERSTR